MTRNSGPFPVVLWGPKKSKRKRGPGRRLRHPALDEHPQDLAVPDATVKRLSIGGVLIEAKRGGPRTNRPSWAMNQKDMMMRCVGEKHMRRFKIADMYWCQGKTASEIAEELELSRNSVKSIINRLVNGG